VTLTATPIILFTIATTIKIILITTHGLCMIVFNMNCVIFLKALHLLLTPRFKYYAILLLLLFVLHRFLSTILNILVVSVTLLGNAVKAFVMSGPTETLEL